MKNEEFFSLVSAMLLASMAERQNKRRKASMFLAFGKNPNKFGFYAHFVYLCTQLVYIFH